MHGAGVGVRLPTQPSGGQQRRIALARAVVIAPGLLLFDEPLPSFDAALREERRIELNRITPNRNVSEGS